MLHILTHIIRPGDTFDRLSKRYNCLVKYIIFCNPGVPARQLQPGEKVFVPQNINTLFLIVFSCVQFIMTWIINPLSPIFDISLPRLSLKHKVVEGESFSSVSRDYRCSEEDLRLANPSVLPNTLQIDDILNLPTRWNVNLLLSPFFFFVHIILSLIAKPPILQSDTSSADAVISEPCSDQGIREHDRDLLAEMNDQ